MGHGKETPRQKMIGMMYLVLTALLALNVSAEILNAFILVDTSLVKTAKNFMKKNEDVYSKFSLAYQENKSKVEPFMKKADMVRVESQKIVSMIDSLKRLMVLTADGPESKFKDSLQSIHIKSKDENNIPSQVMIGSKGDGSDGQGIVLKTAIEEYKKLLVGLIEDKKKGSALIAGIESLLNTDPVPNSEGDKMLTWEFANFYQLPLAGAVTMLSKVQTDIRNTEADIIGYLYGQIDAGSFKFNKIEAIVKSNSNYILKGQNYEAEVFIAASDTSVEPEILLTGGRKLEVKEGKGIYTATGGAVGFSSWGGVIKLEHPATGEILEYPFKTEYQVGEPSLVVSPTKMNVFYIGVDNPVEISVSGVPEDRIQASISGGGKLSKASSGYIVRVQGGAEANISVTAKMDDGSSRNMGTKKFRVKPVPDPFAKVLIGQKDVATPIIDGNMLAAGRVEATLDNFDFDLTFRVTGFRVSAVRQGYVVDEDGNSGRLTSGQANLVRGLPGKSKVTFENITAVGPDGKSRKLNDIVFRLK